MTWMVLQPEQRKPEEYWLCRCMCGNYVTVVASQLRNGEVTMCPECAWDALDKLLAMEEG